MKIVLQCQLADSSGFGVAARQYYNILKKLCKENKWDFKVLIIRADKTLLKEQEIWEEKELIKTAEEINQIVENEEYLFFFHSNLNFASKHKSTYVLSSRAKRNFCLTVWECDKLFTEWEEFLETIGCYDVIVPSTWNAEVFKKELKDFNIHYIPHYDSNKQTYENKGYRLLSISQDNQRKNWNKTISSFYHAFHDKDVEFIIKTNGNLQAPESYQRQQKQAFLNLIKKEKSKFKDSKCRIRLLYSVISEDKIESLYKESTHYFSMTHGEGFGLGILEAKSRGLTVVVPDKGGHVDFCNTNDYMFESSKEYIEDNNHVFPQNSTWFDSTVFNATEALKKSFEQEQKPSKVPESFGFDSVYNKFKEIISE